METSVPYVNCPKCGNRGYVLSPWSAVGRCPTCEAPLSVPRESRDGRVGHRPYFSQPATTQVEFRTELESQDHRGPDEEGAPFAEPAIRPQSCVFQAGTLSALRRLLFRRAEIAGLSRQAAEDLVLAVNEVATNSVLHGGGGGILRLWSEGDALVCEVADRGSIDDPRVGREPPEPNQAGWGLWLAHELCDLVQVRSFASGSAVRLHMRHG